MGRLHLFSRRKRLAAGSVDPLVYDAIDENTRVRVIHVMQRYFKFESHGVHYTSSLSYWESMRGWLREELGVFQLPGSRSYTDNAEEEVLRYFLAEQDIDRLIDWLEMACKIIQIAARDEYRLQEAALTAIADINGWLDEASIGYQYASDEDISNSEFIEVSSRASHAEIIVPTLHVLADRRFAPANSEYRAALDHLRKKEFGDAISEAAKALETTLKIIAAEKDWPHDATKDTLKRLLDIAIKQGPVDPMWQSHFDSVRALLEAGLGTARNRLDSHGQGTQTRKVPDHLAKFAVHQAGSAIMFFAAANGYN